MSWKTHNKHFLSAITADREMEKGGLPLLFMPFWCRFQAKFPCKRRKNLNNDIILCQLKTVKND